MVPESKRHLELRTLLYLLLKQRFAATASIGSEQFVYFRASDPRKCVAPDVFVRSGIPDHDFPSWKTWEKGTPQLAVEIISDSETAQTWADKLASYHEAGVDELVRFEADAPAGRRLRVWDRLEGDLVERVVDADRSLCAPLGGSWTVCPAAGYSAALRLTDERGELLPTAEEAEARTRLAAELRVAELEALLALAKR